MMDERCANVSPPLFVHVTERMPDQMMVTNPAPHVAIHLLESDDFPIRAEFLAVRAYMQELIDKEQAVLATICLICFSSSNFAIPLFQVSVYHFNNYTGRKFQ